MALVGPELYRVIRMTVLAAIGVVAICAEAAPLGLSPTATPSPDLVFCLIGYFAVRRPGSCPLPLVFALGLARDLVTDLPVGAGALTLTLAAEVLKGRGARLRSRPFFAEWLTLAGVLAAMLLVQWVVVLLLLAQPPYLVDLGLQWVVTLVLYPPIALILRWLVRIGWRKLGTH